MSAITLRTRPAVLGFFLLAPATFAYAQDPCQHLDGAIEATSQDGTPRGSFERKEHVYLTGGARGGNGRALAPGFWVFEVTSAGSGELLSTGTIDERTFTVGPEGTISPPVSVGPYGNSPSAMYTIAAMPRTYCAGSIKHAIRASFCAR